MEDLIGKTIESAVSGIVPFFLSEAEVDSYPYAVYYYTPEFHRTKDGVYKIDTDLTLRVYSMSSEEALSLAESVKSAVLAGMNGPQFHTRLASTSKECVDRVWNVEYVYHIMQIS